MAEKPKPHTLVARVPADLIAQIDAIGSSQPIPAKRSAVVVAALREYVARHSRMATESVLGTYPKPDSSAPAIIRSDVRASKRSKSKG